MTADDALQTLKDAIALHKAGKTEEAEPRYREVLDFDPMNPSALQNLALIVNKAGKPDEAIEMMKKSLVSQPNVALFHRNLGSMLRGVKRYQEAVDAVRKAVELAPDDGLAWADMGVSLDQAGYLVEALATYEKAIRLLTPLAQPVKVSDPLPADGTPTMELGRAWYNIGCAWSRIKRIDDAMAAYEASIRVTPNFGESHRNRAAVLFSRGKMGEAWQEYEWRWKCADYPGTFPKLKQPPWDGSDIKGKTILIWWEQGFGDTIMFCRYARVLTGMGARVGLVTQKELKRLMKTLDGPFVVLENNEVKIKFDVHASLMSLPALCKTTLETIPSGKAYLTPDPKDCDEWERRLSAAGKGYRVGLVWAGAAAHKSDAERSIPLTKFAPVLNIPGVRFFSLQMGEQLKQIETAPVPVMDCSPHIHDFADSAALIDRLDLLITVDTAPAHLAGAIGKEVWTLLHHEPDFRWMADTDHPSRWYPTMHLFRQVSPGDWEYVMRRVAKELQTRVERAGAR